VGYTESVLDKMLIKASELPELPDSPLTADYSNMKVGKGWKLSVRQTVKEVNIDNIPYIVYNDSDGTEHYFVEINGEYVDEDGFGLTLTVSGSGENKEYRIENEYGNGYVFNFSVVFATLPFFIAELAFFSLIGYQKLKKNTSIETQEIQKKHSGYEWL